MKSDFVFSHKKNMRKKIWLKAVMVLVIIFLALVLIGGSWLALAGSKGSSSEPVRIERVREASAWSGKRPFTILLLGSDSLTENIAGRSDAIILIRINPQTRRAFLLSVPRDSRVEVPGHGMDKINSAMAFGGPKLAVRTVEAYSGVDIDYYAVTTFKGFVRMIDRVGGLQITIKERINDRFAGAFLPPGAQRLNGGQVLAYSRARHIPGGDFARAAHQQHVAIALFEQSQARSSAFDLMGLMANISQNVTTNLGAREMFFLGKAVFSVPRENVQAFVLPGGTQTIGGASYVIPDPLKAREAFRKLDEL